MYKLKCLRLYYTLIEDAFPSPLGRVALGASPLRANTIFVLQYQNKPKFIRE